MGYEIFQDPFLVPEEVLSPPQQNSVNTNHSLSDTLTEITHGPNTPSGDPDSVHEINSQPIDLTTEAALIAPPTSYDHPPLL